MGRMDPSYVQRYGISMAETPDGEGFVAFDGVGGAHRLNGSALLILDSCAEPRTVAELAEEVRQAYELADAPVDAVERAVADLVVQGLVVDASTVPPPGPLPCTADVEVRSSPAVGRGVFARRAFVRGDLIERCPVIVLGGDDVGAVQRTDLGRYPYGWGEGRSAVVLGFGSLYNHGDEPNAGWLPVEHELVMEYWALRPIAAGEEILVSYGDSITTHGFTPLPTT
jgi:hypothetical protein